jgi:hypothetical protein
MKKVIEKEKTANRQFFYGKYSKENYLRFKDKRMAN